MPALSERLYHAVPLSLPVLNALFLNQGCFDGVQLFRSCFPLPWVDHLALWISMTWLSHCWLDSSHSSVWWFSVQWHLQRTSEALPSVLLYLYWCLSLYCRWIFFFFWLKQTKLFFYRPRTHMYSIHRGHEFALHMLRPCSFFKLVYT